MFFERLEYVFRHTLTVELLVTNGFMINEVVYVALDGKDNILNTVAQLCDDNVDAEVLATIRLH